ncbi:MAG TPA: hypothetical protein ENN45_05330, partial [Bacteroidetes bacterium]|nr:hypothetical protein [Bacteroidota bacterium]
MKNGDTHSLSIKILLFSLIISNQNIYSQSFKQITAAPTTVVKNQASSSTCWVFGTVSFIESEILRKTAQEIDISEMYFVYLCWKQKMEKHIRMQGHSYLSPGGQAHDVINNIKNFGFFFEEEYPVIRNQNGEINHESLDSLILSIRDSIALSGNWQWDCSIKKQKEKTLNQHIAPLPDSLLALQNVEKYDFNPDDYIQISSFSHHDYYRPFCLETKYNWASELYWNLPLSDFMECVDSALYHNYSLMWNGDVSENSFDTYQGIAVLYIDNTSQKIRQQLFDSKETKVDHIMHLVRIAEKVGTKEKYYIIKNSWGETGAYNGYLHMSKRYFKMKSVSVMLHKE